MKRLFFITISLAAALVSFQSLCRADDARPNPPTTGPTTAPTTAPGVEVQPDGSLLLKAVGARIHGYRLHLNPNPEPTLVFWMDNNEYPEWPQVAKKGTYSVEVTYSCPASRDGRTGGEFSVNAAANKVTGWTKTTGDWQDFTTVKLNGTLVVVNDNTSIAIRNLNLNPKARGNDKFLMNVRSIKLTPVADEPVKPRDKKRR